MSKRVQILGHIAELAKSFIGFEREVTADTDNMELRLHDGATEGGFRFLNRDANDNRYQARSVELDGLLGWEPQERGFAVRLGPSNYRLRSLTVNGASLTLTNGNGYAGNPLLKLADEITSDHLWSGTQTFNEEIIAAGGVSGNLVGNSTGTHTGPVVGNVTGNLTGNANGNHTGSFSGDADFEGFGVNFADEQILLEWLAPGVRAAMSLAGLPVGSVVAYAGDLADLPSNWFVCDGTNGTPDLRGRFIVAVSDDYPADSLGGSETHTHGVTIDAGGAHSHTGSASGHSLTLAEMPAHAHKNGVCDFTAANVFNRGSSAAVPAATRGIDPSGVGNYEGNTASSGSGDPHTHDLSIDAGGAHTHTGSTAATGTLPPYYALVYIMKGS